MSYNDYILNLLNIEEHNLFFMIIKSRVNFYLDLDFWFRFIFD